MEPKSPSVSSNFLPIGRRRRGSIISIGSQLDKITLSQALDHIHNAASNSDTLTTFNEFTSPPPRSSGNDRGIAGEIQGGISGLYNRWRTSVGGTKEVIGSVGAAKYVTDDASSVRSVKASDSTPMSVSKQQTKNTKNSSPTTSAASLKLDAAGYDHANTDLPVSGTGKGELQKKEPQSRVTPNTSFLQRTALASGKSSNVASPFKNSNQISLSGPTVAETSFIASKGYVSHSRGSSESTEQRKSNNLSQSTSKEVGPQISGVTKRSDTTEEGQLGPKTISASSSYYRELNSKNVKTTISDVSNLVDSALLENQEGATTPSEVVLSSASSTVADDILKPGLMALDRSSSSQHSMATPLIQEPQEQGPFMERATPSFPGSDLSRDSSTDTGLQSLNTTPLQARRGTDEEAVNTVGSLPQKVLKNKTARDSKGTKIALAQARNRVLSKEYWMKDENAKDCFYCGDPFSTFRRKHHCRTCGQIFDAKCTSLVLGKYFGQSGSLRVCKPCEGIIHGYDDSSEFSDDGSVSGPGLRPRHGSSGATDISPARSLSSMRTATTEVRNDLVPTMAIPATRRFADDSKRRSTILEIDSDPNSVRPSSSRSMKSTLGSRPHSMGHKRHHSKHLFTRGLKFGSEERAPFHINPEGTPHDSTRLPAFHSDNVIDPDLAAYLSDDASSDNEPVNIMEALSGEGVSKSVDHEKGSLSGLLGRQRSRLGDKSLSGLTIGSRDADTVSLSSVKMAASRAMKRRNPSISSNLHFRPSPRPHRFSTASPAAGPHFHGTLNSPAFDQLDVPSDLRMMRSASMNGVDAPSVELNHASVQHVRKLLSQLLRDSQVPNVSSWEKALMPILLHATDDVTPDVQNGDDIDIRHYIKLKKIPGGRPGDTLYVSGLVFTKNLALKSMPRNISYPNILILTFPLEYARHHQHFMSLEPVIRQEKEYLQNLIHRIAALRPSLLLVQRNVSGLALQFLEKAGIATAYNVKASVLEAISRCAQTRIITSIDRLAIKPAHAGTCASFYMKTYKYEERKKTYMYLCGCPKELGCTIALRGGDSEALTVVKRITEFMIYVVYNLKLETSLMRDEFALIPTYTGTGTIEPDKEMKKKFQIDTKEAQYDSVGAQNKAIKESVCNQSGPTIDTQNPESLSDAQMQSSDVEEYLPDDVPMPTFYGDLVEKHKDRILSVSPFVKFMQPYLLTRARAQERRLIYLKRLRDQNNQEEQREDEEPRPEKFVLITPEMVHESIKGASKKAQEVLHAIQDAEYEKAVHNHRTQKKQWESYMAGNGNMFDPFNHQNITVLYSVVCSVTSVPCSGPDLLALGFYNEHETDLDFEADCTLGQYVEDLCLGANTVCIANGCDRKMFDHRRQYVHGDAQLTITVEQYPSKLRGYQDMILMWSKCRVCDKETQVLTMSDNTWKYSYGKYLELSFWSCNLRARAGICPHDIHRDHLRYFGFKNIAVCVQYDLINLVEIIVPRTRITWKVVNDLRFKNEVFTKAEERLNGFMDSVKTRIKSIRIDSVIPEKADACKEEIDRLAKLANDQHQALIRKLQDKYMGSRYFEIIPLNRAIRALQEKVAEWDNIFTDFDKNFFPSEKDIRRLATLQLKKIFLDRDDSVTQLNTRNEKEGTVVPGGVLSEQNSPEETPTLIPQTRIMSPEKAHDMLTAVVENHAGPPHPIDYHQSAPPTALPKLEPSVPSANTITAHIQDIQHLDLALPATIEESEVEEKPIKPESPPASPGSPPFSTNRDFATPAPMEAQPELKIPAEKVKKRESMSGIPRLPDFNPRKRGMIASPPLHRTQSQPAHLRHEKSSNSESGMPPAYHGSPVTNARKKTSDSPMVDDDSQTKLSEKKLADRLGFSAIKAGVSSRSMIPRSIATRRKESKVSSLAKHFELLSREFERERLRDRRQRAGNPRRSRAYPMAASKPIIEEYRNFHEAVAEREGMTEDTAIAESNLKTEKDASTTEAMAKNTSDQTAGEAGFHAEVAAAEDDKEHMTESTAESRAENRAENMAAENSDNDETHHDESHTGSDEEPNKSDEDHFFLDETPSLSDSQSILTPSEAQLDLKIDLPKHEKSSLMKMLTNFWAERSASGWQPLEYPLKASDHVFADSDIIIREDEPSSLIAFALASEDYKAKLKVIQDKSANFKIRHNKPYVEDLFLTTEDQKRIERSLLQSTGTHLKYQFQEGSARMLCKIFYAEQFDAVRLRCGVDHRIVESLSRCLKWDSKGGKTKSVFLKTLDDRLVLKSLSHVETQTFLRFAPSYFEFMGSALFHELPSCIAKMLGFYQITIKNPATSVEFNWFVLVMENLFYDRSRTRTFDLKGSMRNRRIQSTGEQDEVLLDENMVEFIYETPLFSREHSKRLLGSSIWNDTLFLGSQNVMDYSLMIAVDEGRKELVVGIIDCIRTYTWDKKLESWMKDRGKNRPTVTSPQEYKKRFREAMGRYVLQAPR